MNELCDEHAKLTALNRDYIALSAWCQVEVPGCPTTVAHGAPLPHLQHLTCRGLTEEPQRRRALLDTYGPSAGPVVLLAPMTLNNPVLPYRPPTDLEKYRQLCKDTGALRIEAEEGVKWYYYTLTVTWEMVHDMVASRGVVRPHPRTSRHSECDSTPLGGSTWRSGPSSSHMPLLMYSSPHACPPRAPWPARSREDLLQPKKS